jgi:phage FluMu gp28-like protein
MIFSNLFGSSKANSQNNPTPDLSVQQPASTPDHSAGSGVILSNPELSRAIQSEIKSAQRWFLPTQLAWLHDPWHLKIWEKSRQVGATKTDAFDSVMKVAFAGARFDVWVTSRDEDQARYYLEDCLEWAKILHLAATDLGLVILDSKTRFSAHTLQFANGRRIYSLSSNPLALAGKRGHVKIDEFALHQDQRQLYRVAKPVCQWGGTFSIISTHGDRNTVFNQFIRDIRENGNPMDWHLFSYPIHKAVEEGIVERINAKSGRNESREQFLARTRRECSDNEHWLREYCCTPSDENSAFITFDMIAAVEDPFLHLMSLPQFLDHAAAHPESLFFLGMDVARKTNLCVIDVGEKIGDLVYDRLRIEMLDKTYTEMESHLHPLLALENLQYACFDSNGIGNQLCERAAERFPWKVEGFKMTAADTHRLAYGLHADFTEHRLRIPLDDNLRADLRAVRKQVTSSGHLRLEGSADDSHCDRFWAKALRQQATRHQPGIGSELGW